MTKLTARKMLIHKNILFLFTVSESLCQGSKTSDRFCRTCCLSLPVTWTRVVAENECISAFKGYNRHSDNHSAQVVLCKRGGCAVQTVRHWLLNCVTTEVGLV